MTRIIRYQLRKEGQGVWDVCDIQTGSGVPPPTPSPLSHRILMRRYTTSWALPQMSQRRRRWGGRLQVTSGPCCVCCCCALFPCVSGLPASYTHFPTASSLFTVSLPLSLTSYLTVSLSHSLTPSLSHPLTPSPPHSLTLSLTPSLLLSLFSLSLFPLFPHSLTPLTSSLTVSLPHPLTSSLTVSLPHSSSA